MERMGCVLLVQRVGREERTYREREQSTVYVYRYTIATSFPPVQVQRVGREERRYREREQNTVYVYRYTVATSFPPVQGKVLPVKTGIGLATNGTSAVPAQWKRQAGKN